MPSRKTTLFFAKRRQEIEYSEILHPPAEGGNATKHATAVTWMQECIHFTSRHPRSAPSPPGHVFQDRAACHENKLKKMRASGKIIAIIVFESNSNAKYTRLMGKRGKTWKIEICIKIIIYQLNKLHGNSFQNLKSKKRNWFNSTCPLNSSPSWKGVVEVGELPEQAPSPPQGKQSSTVEHGEIIWIN